MVVEDSSASSVRGQPLPDSEAVRDEVSSWLAANWRQIGFDMPPKAVETLFPHHVSHYIGMDVHDTAGYTRKVLLQEGHCITIEPGVYVPDDERWPKHFRNIGIRIEDSVSVQDDNPFVLTPEAVKEVVDIEALRD